MGKLTWEGNFPLRPAPSVSFTFSKFAHAAVTRMVGFHGCVVPISIRPVLQMAYWLSILTSVVDQGAFTPHESRLTEVECEPVCMSNHHILAIVADGLSHFLPNPQAKLHSFLCSVASSFWSPVLYDERPSDALAEYSSFWDESQAQYNCCWRGPFYGAPRKSQRLSLRHLWGFPIHQHLVCVCACVCLFK